MINRIQPLGPAEAYKTYQIRQPVRTHFRPATCAEVECESYAHGWTTTIDAATPTGVQQARYIVDRSGRAFTQARGMGSLVVFTFAPGQRCFAEHKVPLEREPFYVVKGGDWRGNPRRVPVTQHARSDDWVDDFATHQDQLAQRIQRG
jgi:hypothetical protein